MLGLSMIEGAFGHCFSYNHVIVPIWGHLVQFLHPKTSVQTYLIHLLTLQCFQKFVWALEEMHERASFHRRKLSYLLNFSCECVGIRYVVDAGRAKQKVLEGTSCMAKYEVGWISKASAEQRAGRAGRTGPGHCYRSLLLRLMPLPSRTSLLVMLRKLSWRSKSYYEQNCDLGRGEIQVEMLVWICLSASGMSMLPVLHWSKSEVFDFLAFPNFHIRLDRLSSKFVCCLSAFLFRLVEGSHWSRIALPCLSPLKSFATQKKFIDIELQKNGEQGDPPWTHPKGRTQAVMAGAFPGKMFAWMSQSVRCYDCTTTETFRVISWYLDCNLIIQKKDNDFLSYGFRLFSSAVYNDQFAQHTPPEILNTSLDGVILNMKAMGIEKVRFLYCNREHILILLYDPPKLEGNYASAL